MIPVEGWSFKKAKWTLYYIAIKMVRQLAIIGYEPSPPIKMMILFSMAWIMADFKNDYWDTIKNWGNEILNFLDTQFGIDRSMIHHTKLTMIRLVFALCVMGAIAMCACPIFILTPTLLNTRGCHYHYYGFLKKYIVVILSLAMVCVFISHDIVNELAKTLFGYDFGLIQPNQIMMNYTPGLFNHSTINISK